MTRAWIRRAMIAGLVVAVIAPVCTIALADNDTVLTGVTESRDSARQGKRLVARFNNSPYVGPPGQLPEDPDPPKQMPHSFAVGNKSALDAVTGHDGSLGTGVGMIAASPQTRLENSLKGLAKELR